MDPPRLTVVLLVSAHWRRAVDGGPAQEKASEDSAEEEQDEEEDKENRVEGMRRIPGMARLYKAADSSD